MVDQPLDANVLLQRAREAQFGMMTDQLLQTQVALQIAHARADAAEARLKALEAAAKPERAK